MKTIEIEIPEGVQVRKDGYEFLFAGPKGELKREFRNHELKLDVRDRKILISADSERRKVKALAGTWAAHTKNMITGVTRGYEARLKVLYSHFPMKLNVENDHIVVNNFLGERSSRISKIVGDTKVELKKDEVIVRGISRDDVGQTAANLEILTKVKGYDRRVFQDGCHLVQKTMPVQEGE